MVKFELSNPTEGRMLIGGRYTFIDGVFECNDADALKVGKILTTFYGCKKLQAAVKPTAVKKDASTDTSLQAAVTKVEAAKK